MRAFIAAAAVLMLLGSAANAQCTSDDQCVPATCCHPDTCVYAPTAPFLNCTDVMCTLMCMPGTMDCGQGHCACNADGQCFAQTDDNSETKPSIQEPPIDDSCEEKCVPSQCCGASTCVKASMAPDCTAVLCPAVCLPGTLDCGQGYCVCEEGTCQARFFEGETRPVLTPESMEAVTPLNMSGQITTVNLLPGSSKPCEVNGVATALGHAVALVMTVGGIWITMSFY